jgi:hypothetical protein
VIGVQPIDIPGAVGLEDLLLACTTAEVGPRERAALRLLLLSFIPTSREFVIGLKGVGS